MSEFESFTNSPKRNGSRTRRIILASISFLILSLTATQIFLHQTSVGSPRFIRMTFLLYAVTVLVVLALLILATVLGRNLIKLYFEKKRGQVGIGFKTKMVRTFIALSLLPAMLLFFLAYNLISSSIEQWFRAPLAQIMENSRALAEQYYTEVEQRARMYAAYIAGNIESSDGLTPELRATLQEKLQEFCRHYQLGSIRIFDAHARLIASAGIAAADARHQGPIQSLVSQSILGQPGFSIERASPDDALNEIAWATALIRDPQGNIAGVVLTEAANPQSANFKAHSIMEAYDKYEQLQGEKAALRFNSLLVLVLATLLIVFAFSWFALYLAKRITVPIEALAQGAAAVATGNLGYRVNCQAFDELESLIASFNRMTGDLQENKNRIEAAQQILRQTNVELDDRRRYTETILQTIATGVISLDSNHTIRTMNRAAMQMLQVDNNTGQVRLEDVVPAPCCEIIKALLHKSSVLGTVVRNIELPFPGKVLQLAATVTPLTYSAEERTGWVMVLDDMTELLRIEKMSAWQEVARRLAHEIKNPLTPIQLSAERILRRYRQLPQQQSQPELSRFDQLLNECVQTIIQEAGSLKNLVDEFSRFARLPEVRLEDSDLNRILDSTLNLYDGRIQGVTVHKDFDPMVPVMPLDPEQMKRVFINLFDNALEAMADNPHKKVLYLCTRLNGQRRSVSVEIGDTGRGFPEEYQDSLFLPYFSTRKGGTGLGLAIVRQIVSDHHGSVRAEPNGPVGTKIVIDLPLAPV